MKEKRIGRLQVGAVFVKQLLGLPEGTEIRSIRMNPERCQTIEILIEDRSLDEVKPGNRIPEVKAVYGVNGFMGFSK